jgi:hypothetical protein
MAAVGYPYTVINFYHITRCDIPDGSILQRPKCYILQTTKTLFFKSLMSSKERYGMAHLYKVLILARYYPPSSARLVLLPSRLNTALTWFHYVR